MEKEIWKDIEGYEGIYKISTMGRVMSLKFNREKIMKNALMNGREFTSLLKNGKYTRPYISRLVAMAFIPNPEQKEQVNHINGIKTDNRLENLEWSTRSENINHGIKNNLIKHERGEKHSRSILTEQQVLIIRGKRTQGEKLTSIAKEFNVSIGCIQGIISKKTWSHI